MHKPNILILGSSSFISTINELKSFLTFNCLFGDLSIKHDIILFHKDVLKDKKQKNLITISNATKICASNEKLLSNNFDAYLELPTTTKEINSVVENVSAKKIFNKNSSIKIRGYLLNKNEKKLSKKNNFLILTEKEVQLLELFLHKKEPISKENILANVWNYSAEADTHTVETHIYRLRKKINDKFMDEEFILNNKNGYYL
tara:strand:+ start:592 stop:1197 length:606 start_codon:yes stop_codon:yes gene_type:complete